MIKIEAVDLYMCANLQCAYDIGPVFASQCHTCRCAHGRCRERSCVTVTCEVSSAAVDQRGGTQQDDHREKDEPDLHVRAASKDDVIDQVDIKQDEDDNESDAYFVEEMVKILSDVASKEGNGALFSIFQFCTLPGST